MKIEIRNATITLDPKELPGNLTGLLSKAHNYDDVTGVDIPMENGTLARFDITDRGENWIRFDSCDCLGSAPWNKDGGNLNGDIQNASITEYVVTKIEPWFPEWLYEMIIFTERLTDDGYYTTKLFLPDASEIFGRDDDWYVNRYERLDYYKDAHHRVKTKPGEENACSWWTASAYSGSATGVVYGYAYGMGNYSASNVYGVPVCFRINKADFGRLIREALNSGGTVRRIERRQ